MGLPTAGIEFVLDGWRGLAVAPPSADAIATAAEATADAFRPFSAPHAWAVAVFLALLGGAVTVGRLLRRRSPTALRRAEMGVGWFALIFWSYMNFWYLRPSNFDPSVSLPLHLCDLALALVPLVLLLRWRPARALLYYWGLGFSSQAFLTPTLGTGPSTVPFWLFWISHGLIVGVALYDLAVSRFRPSWSDWRLALIIASIWFFGTLLLINVPFNFNYGFSGRSDTSNPTVIDLLGPWPLRVVPLYLIGVVAMVVLTVPWVIVRRLESRRQSQPPDAASTTSASSDESPAVRSHETHLPAPGR